MTLNKLIKNYNKVKKTLNYQLFSNNFHSQIFKLN